MRFFLNFSIVVVVCIGCATAWSPASAQTGKKRTNTVEIDVLVDNTAFAAIEEAAKQVPSAVLTGKIYTIPLSALKGAAVHIALLKIGDRLSCDKICRQFQIWALSYAKRKLPFSDDPAFNIEVKLVDDTGATLMIVTVPFFAKCNSINSKGEAVGYAAPIGPKGATMKLDVFGDGKIILERIECPCP
ncbi:hypothetical protein MASR2M18_02560 [Ignavibacteria bacterium]|nr:hypothetical protein [Bacteroidota bacterium]